MTQLSGQRRLLITGVSGFLGWPLARLAQATWQVEGTYHRHPIDLPGVGLHWVDLTDTDALMAWLQALAPDAVIHTAALSQPNRCEQQPEVSYTVNVEATRTLATYCGQRGIPLVFTSTDQVFDGQGAPYDETSAPNPINRYGQHKLAAEQLIQCLHPQAVICRLPLLYGPATPTAECFLQGFLRTLAARQPLRLFIDEFRTPAHGEDVAQGLLLALEKASGLLHLGGPERLSRYDFGLKMAAVFQLEAGLIVPSRQGDVAMPAARPADVSTHSRLALGLGYRPRGIEAGLRAVLQTMTQEPRP
ncbi:NAD(P)-dependent oxidoreductase [Nodosilinea sp. P-1105]|uniref:SDR family oxidoreductase n=1 Tax=Nodosilinea sp. P-1105 TaxID=2546229 RepID=UPI00146CF12A|nr:NAD(P)-dependent oxidoreductase [Nodosilinea sp. P-1105]NMF81858.1 NAD(P)-dependent oxidoreductase [Nodosilinea sp. P-1105]